MGTNVGEWNIPSHAITSASQGVVAAFLLKKSYIGTLFSHSVAFPGFPGFSLASEERILSPFLLSLCVKTALLWLTDLEVLR